jgi:biopolymer transport protein TolR
VVDLPSVGRAQQRAPKVVEVIVGTDERLRVRVDQQEPAAVAVELDARVRALQRHKPSVPVLISADRAVRYEAVVRVMDRLKRAGIHRVGLSVRQEGG